MLRSELRDARLLHWAFLGRSNKSRGYRRYPGWRSGRYLWWSLKHVLDPGALSENYGAPLGVIVFALFNSIMGLTLTGGLIGLIVNSMQNMLVAAKQGSSTIEEDGHVIILGWNKRGLRL